MTSSARLNPRWTGGWVADPESLANLLRLVADGDTEAFVNVYEMVAGQVMAYAEVLLRDRSQAEEVTQEVFVEIWFRAGQFDSERGSAPTWVKVLTHSRSVDRVRSAQAARVRDARFFRRSFVPERDSTVEDVIRTEDHHQVRQALRGLTVLQREALELTFYAGHTYREASQLLNIPLPTFKTRARGALAALREATILVDA